MKKLLLKIFKKLDKQIEEENRELQNSGTYLVPKCEVKILGQMSLLANDKIATLLHLAQTGDMDALITTHTFIKTTLNKILGENGLLYDEDSEKIWIPPGAQFEKLFELPHVTVKLIDAESALVSKAVKAPAKNKPLIREALASGRFKTLSERILKHGGKLEAFL